MLPPRDDNDARLLIDDMESHYRKAFMAFEEDDNFYEGLIGDIVEFPEGFDITIPTTARAIVDEAVDNVDPYDMAIKYSARGMSKVAQEDAEEISRFLKNLWLYWRSSNSDIDILRDFIKNLFKNGKAIFKVVPDWSLWPSLSEAEEKKLLDTGGREAVAERAKIILALRKRNFPLVCRSMSPRHIMEDPSLNSRKLWVIERYDGNIKEIEDKYAEFLPEIQNVYTFNGAAYQIHEIWTATWVDWNGVMHKGKHWIFVNRFPVVVEDNPYHELPYVIKYSGLGRETYDGKPEIKATGFFTLQVKSMLRAEIRRISHFDAMMSQLAFPIAFFPESVQDMDLDIEPGAVNYVPDEVLDNFDKIFLQARLPEGSYLTSLNMIQNQIERGTTQRAVRGAGVPGTDSAAQLAMVTSQAKLRLQPVQRATEEAVDAVNAIVLNYIENILEEPVSVFGAEENGTDRYTVSPKQIKGKFRTRTTFLPSEETIKERKFALMSDARAKGLNPYDAAVFANWENPMEMIERDLAYQVMQEPAVRRQLAKQALKDWGLDTMELELEEQLEVMQLNNIIQQAQQEMQQQNPQPPQAPEGGMPPEGQMSPDQMMGMMPEQIPQQAPGAAPMPPGGNPAEMSPQAIGAPTNMMNGANPIAQAAAVQQGAGMQ